MGDFDNKKDIILALDIGSTNVKVAAILIDGSILRIEYKSLQIVSPHPGWSEIDPDQLWEDIVSMMKSISNGIEKRILTIGISTQRATFLTFNKSTGKHLHNFITWLDIRTRKMCEDWNNRFIIRNGRKILWGLGNLVQSKHMICAASFVVTEQAVQMRLKWVMDNISEASELYLENNLAFATLDTWLIYKLTGGKVWATDYTNAGATGIYDLWDCKWCPVMTNVFGNPINALPEVRDCNAFFGKIDPLLELGFTSPIYGVLGDQQASVIGNRLFKKGDMKLTLGTSLSASIVTGSYIHPVANEIYPQIAWKLKDQDVCYVAEGIGSNGGKSIEWTVKSGLVDKLENLDSVCRSVSSSDGVCFTGFCDDTFSNEKSGCLVGISAETTKSQIVRAIMESQIFKSRHVIDTLIDFYSAPDKISVDGGVSKSDFIVENVANLVQTDVHRLKCFEGSLMGAFYMAGLGIGYWKSFEDIRDSFETVVFSSKDNCTISYLSETYKMWLTTLQGF